MKRNILIVSLLISLIGIGSFVIGKETEPVPPKAKIVPKITEFHGDKITDPYYWLRNSNDPDVLAYLKAENEYTSLKMQHTLKLQEKLNQEMRSRIKETDLSVPERIDDYLYYQRTEANKQYPIYCRRKVGDNTKEEILLDQNELAADSEYLEIGLFKVSPNHKLIAFSVDRNGSELYTVHFKDLDTNRVFTEEIPRTYYGGAWGNDNKTFFYVVLDAAKRPYRVFRHTLGTEASKDVLVHDEKDEHFWVGLAKTRSEKYILIQSGSSTTAEVLYVDADRPQESPKIVQPRIHGIEYSVDHRGDQFYVLTNAEALQFKLVSMPVNAPAKSNWVEIIPHRNDVLLEGLDLFQDFLIVYERDRGQEKIRIQNLSDNTVEYVAFDEPVYTVSSAENPEFKTDTLRFHYESFLTPYSVFDYNLRTKKRTLLKEKEVPGYDRSKYQSERIFAKASDGALVPVSLLYKKGTPKDGTAPVYLYGYGAYGANWEIDFSSDRLSLLDRGFVYAVAHIRGSGFMGRNWYLNGKMLKKMNTFTDFIAAAEHLIAEKYCDKSKIAISGISAGGLLMGAVTNLRPDLFRVVIARVPFIDVVNDMADPTIPLVVTEYEEWGNSAIEEQYRYMKKYSPYDNVAAKEYPAMLLTASWNDQRVPYWEAPKMTAKLRATQTGKNDILLKTNLGGASHTGSSGRFDQLKEVAFEYAFILDQLGMN
jgi:oligopeptidase B